MAGPARRQHDSSWFPTSDNNIEFRIEVVEDYQNEDDNVSTLNVRIYSRRKDNGFKTSGYGTAYIRYGTELHTRVISEECEIIHGGVHLMNTTLIVPHDDDGKKSIYLSAWIQHTHFSTQEYGCTFNLTPIPRKKPCTPVIPYPEPQPKPPEPAPQPPVIEPPAPPAPEIAPEPGKSIATWISPWYNATNNFRYRIEVTAVNRNLTQNNSKIKVEVFMYRKYKGSARAQGKVWCRVDGVLYSNDVNQCVSHTGKYVFSQYMIIPHNADGTKKIFVSSWFKGCISSCENGMTITLPPIQRRDKIAAVTGGTIGSSMIVSLQKSCSTAACSVYLQVNGSASICVAEKTKNSNIAFVIPNNLANYITDNTRARGKVTVKTYTGNSVLGEDSWDVWFYVPESMKISIKDLDLQSDTTHNDIPIWIKDKSKIGYNIVPDNSKAYGATITSYKLTFDGNNYNTKNGWLNPINKFGSFPVKAYITDSRGRTQTMEKIIIISDYVKPSVELIAYRCDDEGIQNQAGTKIKLAYNCKGTPIDGYNTFNIKITYREAGKEWSSPVLTSSQPYREASILNGVTCDTDKVYEIKATFSDKYETVEAIKMIPGAFVLLDFKAGGRGIGLGKTSSKDYNLDLAMNLDLYPNLVSDERYIRYTGKLTHLKFNDDIECNNDTYGLGWKLLRTGKLYLQAAYATESDERLKYDIDEFSNWDDYYNFYMSLKPKTFRYNNDMKEQTHLGMIAQDVADSIVDNNLMNDNLSIVHCMENDAMEDGREYALAYQQLIPLNVKMIQKHEEEIKELKKIISELKDK